MASPNIQFDSIPASIRKPGRYGEFNTSLAVRALPGNRQKVVIIGQHIPSVATLAADELRDVYDADQVASWAGRGSISHLMVRAALTANPRIALSVISVAPAGGSAPATSTVTFTGPATTSGRAVAHVDNFPEIAIAIASGDTATTMAAAMKARFDAAPDLPVSATVSAGVITLTAKCNGPLGMYTDVVTEVNAAGVTLVASAPSGGTGTADITTALAKIFAAGHDVIITAGSGVTTLTALRAHINAVGAPTEQRGAIGVTASTDTLGTVTTNAPQINSGSITLGHLPGTNSLPYEVAAAYGAVLAGEEDPARPLNTLTLPGIHPPPVSARLSRNEQETDLYNGVTPLEVGPGEMVQIVRSISTYIKNAANVNDPSLLDITTMRSLNYVRKAMVERMGLRFPRSKRSVRVLSQIREEALDVLYKLEELEIVEGVKENEDGVLVELDLQDASRVNVRVPTDVVNGLHILGMRFDLLL